MGEIFESPIYRDPSKIPKDVSFTDFLFRLWRKQVPKVGDKAWLVDTTSGKQILYKDVETRVKRVASGLARRGFGHGDFLFFVTHDIVDLYVLQMAVWMLGGATRSSFQKDPSDEYARQMSEVKCKFVALDAETAPILLKAVAMLKFKCDLINLDEKEVEGTIKFAELAEDDGTAFPSEVNVNREEDILFVCNTSGTTGSPKGVIITHYTFLVFFSGAESSEMYPEEDQFITSHNHSISNVWTAIGKLATGNTMYCMGHFAKEKLAEHLLQYKPAKILLYPFIAAWFARLPDIGKHDFGFVKHIIVGGSVLDPTTAELLQKICPSAAFVQAYGSTEALLVSKSSSGNDKGPLFNVTPDGERMVSSGFLLPLVQAKITDLETGDLLGRKQLGRLHVRSIYSTVGYLVPGGKPDRPNYDKDGWFDTGDMAFFDSFGQLFVRGRASFVFRYLAEFVSPSEIEAVLHEHPSVALSCVIGVPNAQTNNLTKALVVLKKGKSATEEELKGFVAEKMSYYKQLHGGVIFVDSLPENRGGKLDRLTVWRQYCRMN